MWSVFVVSLQPTAGGVVGPRMGLKEDVIAQLGYYTGIYNEKLRKSLESSIYSMVRPRFDPNSSEHRFKALFVQ
jgi:hypothetical protein